MAKRSKINPGFRAKHGRTAIIPTKVLVHRTAERGSTAFEACIRIGSRYVRGGRGSECAFGKNPRKAVANALTRLAKHMRGRKGAFRGARR